MKNANIILLLSCSLHIPVTSVCQVPVILSQPKEVIACDGDLVTLEVVTDGVYCYQWYSALKDYEKGFYNFTELVGENSNTLILNQGSKPLYSENFYYFLRIINKTDTVWSSEILLRVKVLDRAVDDTLLVCQLPCIIYISKFWSVGDNKKYNQVEQPGAYWLTTTDRNYGCTRTDTFRVVSCPEILHMYKNKKSYQYWCADTVYIENDIDMARGVTVFPGTTVKFKGNYRLNARAIEAFGDIQDSVYILGNTDTIQQSNQGYLYSPQQYNSCEEPLNRFHKLVIKNMRMVDLANTYNTHFYEIDSLLRLNGVRDCVIGYNKRVEISQSVVNSSIYQNDSVFGITASCARCDYSPFFASYQNSFTSNKTGLIIKGEPDYSATRIFNNIFDNNKSTAITVINSPNSYIDQNIFRCNISQNSSSVLKVLYNAEDQYSYDDWNQIEINFINNTLFDNKGKNEIGIACKDTSSGIDVNIINNIFWNRSTQFPFNIEINDSPFHEFNVTNNSFNGDESSLILPADTNTHIAENLFKTYPDFKDTLNSLFVLKHSSPLIDRGTDSISVHYYNHPITTDFNGNPRKIGSAIDIGAYEYQSTAPLAFSYITPDTLVCLGDSITLKAFPAILLNHELIDLNWYKNGERLFSAFWDTLCFNPFFQSDTGRYYAALSNSVDTLLSDPIYIDYEVPPLIINDQNLGKEVCMGMGVKFQIETKSHRNAIFEWNSIKNGKLPSTSDTCYISSALETDTLYVTATNVCGSSSSVPIMLIVFPLPVPNLGNDTTIYPGDSIMLDAGPDYISYLWCTGEQGQQTYSHAGDTVWVMVTNMYSCEGRDTVIVSSNPVTDKTFRGNGLTCIIYPNPAKDRLFLRLACNADLPSQISIVSQDGKLIRQLEIRDPEEQVIDISAFEKGIYFLHIQSDSNTGTKKIIVM